MLRYFVVPYRNQNCGIEPSLVGNRYFIWPGKREVGYRVLTSIGMHTGSGIKEVGHRLLTWMGTKEVWYKILPWAGMKDVRQCNNRAGIVWWGAPWVISVSSPLLLNGKEASPQETGFLPVHSQQSLCRSSKGVARNAAKLHWPVKPTLQWENASQLMGQDFMLPFPWVVDGTERNKDNARSLKTLGLRECTITHRTLPFTGTNSSLHSSTSQKVFSWQGH